MCVLCDCVLVLSKAGGIDVCVCECVLVLSGLLLMYVCECASHPLNTW